MNIEMDGIPTLDFETTFPPLLSWRSRISLVSRFDELVKLLRLVPREEMYRISFNDERA